MNRIYKYTMSIDSDGKGVVLMRKPIQILNVELSHDVTELIIWAIVGEGSGEQTFKVCPTGAYVPMSSWNGNYDHIKTVIHNTPGQIPLVWHIFDLGWTRL